MALTVSEVARLAGVTVRTLHHYDEIGRVRPSGRTDAGHRLYDREAIERLQAVLLYRELGLALADIQRLLSDPDWDREQALLEHREQLEKQADRLGHLIAAVDAELDALRNGTTMNETDMLEVFGQTYVDHHADWEAEAAERWGDTDAYAESQRRTSQYTKEDWQRIAEEGSAIERDAAALFLDGVEPTSEAATEVAERHRQHISGSFYDCTHEIHVGLADMYVADERFRAHYDEQAEGLAEWLQLAILANADRNR
ncbi:MAG: MerR family transcriptional regulator [Nitriliruptorales bacterium]|nr:MerR family transcriptional regulator [Nitriliruptorales bacterium]